MYSRHVSQRVRAHVSQCGYVHVSIFVSSHVSLPMSSRLSSLVVSLVRACFASSSSPFPSPSLSQSKPLQSIYEHLTLEFDTPWGDGPPNVYAKYGADDDDDDDVSCKERSIINNNIISGCNALNGWNCRPGSPWDLGGRQGSNPSDAQMALDRTANGPVSLVAFVANWPEQATLQMDPRPRALQGS